MKHLRHIAEYLVLIAAITVCLGLALGVAVAVSSVLAEPTQQGRVT